MSDSTTADVERAEWERRTLITLAQYHNGIAFRPSELGTEGTRVIRIEQLNKPNGHYDRVAGLFPAANQIANGDLIFSWSATLKVVVWQHGNAVLNQHLFKVIPHGDVELRFLFYLLDFNMDDLSGSSHGSTMKHVKRSELKTFGVDLPPPSRAAKDRLDSDDGGPFDRADRGVDREVPACQTGHDGRPVKPRRR